MAVVMFTTNTALLHAAELNFLAQRRQSSVPMPAVAKNFNPASLLPASAAISSRLQLLLPKESKSLLLPIVRALPQNSGTIRKIAAPATSSGRVVIHIQDVHQNQEAQRNIGKAIQALIEAKTVGLVALEGAFAPVDLSWYRSYPHQAAVHVAADWLLKENRISGPIHAALGLRPGQVLPAFVGVDQIGRYDANVEAYRRAAPLVESFKKIVSQRARLLSKQKAATFNSALRQFEARLDAYRNGSLAWGDYVRFLARYREELSPKMQALLATLELERTLNFGQVETQRAQLITCLIAKLTTPEIEALVNESTAYQLGTLDHSDFYGYLKKLCAQKNIDLERLPAMAAYIRYVLLCDSLDVTAILQEIANTEQRIISSLAKTDAKRNLLAQSAQLNLTAKLLNFSLTREEWGNYKTDKLVNGNWKPARPAGGLDRGVINKSSSIQLPITIYQSLNLSSFERFYSEAEARDQAMAANLEKAMDASGFKVAVLVTGGFHSDGILRRLQSHGMTVVSYVPKISKISDENGSGYLSAFTQEKTPLDRLFDGNKLFLAQDPTRGLNPPLFEATELALESPVRRGGWKLPGGGKLWVLVGAGGAISSVWLAKRGFNYDTIIQFLSGVIQLLHGVFAMVHENKKDPPTPLTPSSRDELLPKLRDILGRHIHSQKKSRFSWFQEDPKRTLQTLQTWLWDLKPGEIRVLDSARILKEKFGGTLAQAPSDQQFEEAAELIRIYHEEKKERPVELQDRIIAAANRVIGYLEHPEADNWFKSPEKPALIELLKQLRDPANFYINPSLSGKNIAQVLTSGHLEFDKALTTLLSDEELDWTIFHEIFHQRPVDRAYLAATKALKRGTYRDYFDPKQGPALQRDLKRWLALEAHSEFDAYSGQMQLMSWLAAQRGQTIAAYLENFARMAESRGQVELAQTYRAYISPFGNDGKIVEERLQLFTYFAVLPKFAKFGERVTDEMARLDLGFPVTQLIAKRELHKWILSWIGDPQFWELSNAETSLTPENRLRALLKQFRQNPLLNQWMNKVAGLLGPGQRIEYFWHEPDINKVFAFVTYTDQTADPANPNRVTGYNTLRVSFRTDIADGISYSDVFAYEMIEVLLGHHYKSIGMVTYDGMRAFVKDQFSDFMTTWPFLN